MRRIALLAIAAGFLTPLLAAAPASAQATRTWVSGVGDDANPCSRTAPCKTFAGAMSKTATGGEINCLDPAGYGGVTVTKALTLNCGYTLGSILVAGVPGITVNATGATDRVTIRGIQLTGINQTATPGTIGIRILAANAVSIENSVISNFGQQGIADQRTAGNTKLFIRDTIISNNSGNGISLTATNTSKTDIVNTSILNNLNGIASGTGNSTVVKRSVIAGNSTGVETDAGAQMDVDDSSVNNNGVGIQANGTIRMSNSEIANNATATAGTGAQSYGNNRMNGNTSNGAGLAAVVPGEQ
ncbi:MAG: hypothetical protein QOD40_873 [Alphaproteobacteria bacterium]|jgi:hypothetical protein|nr:hypothetical protein [Alphaproteobacteria bacterium]